MGKELRIIISGGGTGGHIFPAISIANAIKEQRPGVKILFVGAEGRMEMQRVPDAGYKIIGLPITGIDRKFLWKNFSVLFNLLRSQRKARRIIKKFRPHVVVGVGGYASGPLLKTAQMMKIPTLIQEQNSYAGVTNKLLAKRAEKICVAYSGMEKFFPSGKIILTGNPVRQELFENRISREKALSTYGFDSNKKTVLILGGSLGAYSINQCLTKNLDTIRSAADIQFIWQTGKIYYEQIIHTTKTTSKIPNLYITGFVKDMTTAYMAADLIVSRAGAGAISEFCLLQKAVILIPSPNVAEDHQTKNAMALVNQSAAIYVQDANINETLLSKVIEVIHDEKALNQLRSNIAMLALPDSANIIAEEVFKMVEMDIKSVYFIGIGGIGMSALARYFLSKGKIVAGYDRTPCEITGHLIKEGIPVHYEENLSLIPSTCLDKETTLVIWTPAVPETHVELTYFRTVGFEIQKRSQVLGAITRSSKGLCVAGTHGKTTTSAILAHLLYQSHIGCNAFLGGISKNYHTNLLLSQKSPYTVIEADEFDRSFHQLTPYMSVITATDPDHLDVYGSEEAYFKGFEIYTGLIKSCLVIHKNSKLQPRVKKEVRIYTYSKNEGDFHAENICMGNGEIFFDFVAPDTRITDIQLGVPININIENSVAAISLAYLNGVSVEEIKCGMASFRGVDRRFDFKIKNDRIVFLNDYAHHPFEIQQSLLSIRELYTGKKITAVFQPHLYTRTRDFYKEFATSLSLADEVILLDIYPARELPISGVTSELIYERLQPNVKKSMCSKESLTEILKSKKMEVLVTLGAGDIDDYIPAVAQILENQWKKTENEK
ncbi:UDP-N-acetylmuramate--L-alanine ligase [termite gut metagenome]|uniref:UDP-N-acetylmuramate--L-alanine ligase n=1 Tax=termite gut metagenome TaxID=433724 RepID=A0A5J4SVR0_9ZZZZ